MGSKRDRTSLRCLLLGSALLLVPGFGAAEDLALLGSGVSETHDCAGGAIQIAGGNNVYRFTGACGDLEILGGGNTIAVELAPGSDIQIVGSGNAVEYTVAGGGPVPDVNTVGGDNVVRPAASGGASATVDVETGGGGVVGADDGASAAIEVRPGEVELRGAGGEVGIAGGAVTLKGGGGSATIGVAPAAGEALVIEGSGLDVTRQCAGQSVVIRGSGSTLELTGGCAGLRVEGSGNTISAELADGAAIVIDGSGNEVRWSMPEGGRPNVESNGTGNAVVRVSAAGGGAAPGTRVTIAGSEARLAAAVDAAARASTEELRTQVQAVDTGDGTAVSLPNDILFAFDSSALRPDAIETLARVAELVRREGVARVEIVGHTDAIGSDAYNLELSERRARAVQAWLATDAALNATMLIEGRGEADPVSANTRPDGSDDPEGRQRNRRVELTMARE